LVVANLGDCRAVLCSLAADANSVSSSNGISNNKNNDSNSNNKNSNNSDGSLIPKIYATRLTRDHNCRELVEDLKLRHEHPGEADVVYCKTSGACYVKRRLQLTRAFGDLYFKHREFNGSPNSKRSKGRHIPDPYTPPYLSATPDIHHVRISPGQDKFIILASDGVWDFLSDQEAAEFVYSAMVTQNMPLEDVSRKLVERTLLVAAREAGISVDEMKALPPGDRRRGLHDDTTAVIIRL
jgi:pyruvate dehydrogenase phosphatase